MNIRRIHGGSVIPSSSGKAIRFDSTWKLRSKQLLLRPVNKEKKCSQVGVPVLLFKYF